MQMIVYLYRWKIKTGRELQFEENWSIVTKAILDQCGSYGSRLHRSAQGEYLGYAQWPDQLTRDKCELDASVQDARVLMRDAIEYSYEDDLLEIRSDYLVHQL